jgi:phospholipid-binding lipoprotein MlaA
MLKNHIQLKCLLSTLCIALFTGCASTSKTSNNDPHESMNRKIYSFNDTLDKKFIEPIAEKYVAVTPAVVRKGVTNFFDNASYLNTITNDILQGKPIDFFKDTGRFVVNSTLGIGGLFDPATSLGMPLRKEDLGQTLGKWGADEGAYLTLPFMGPSSYRDVSAPVMSIFTNPLTYLAAVVTVPAGVVRAINSRANLLEASRLRDQAALDPYAFVREAWRQQREYSLYDGNPPGDGFDDFIDGEGDAAILRIY